MLNIFPNLSQKKGLDDLRKNWNKYRSFMICSPTGSGKTALAAFIIDGCISKGLRVLFICPYCVLLEQTARRFIDYGIDSNQISYIWKNHPGYDPEKLIQIASADTLIRREFPKNTDLVFVDEAHIRRKTLLQEIEKGQFRVIGLSATPFSSFLGNYYQCLITPVSVKELTDKGILSPYEIFAPSAPDLTGVKTIKSQLYGTDYDEKQLAAVMSKNVLVADIVENWLENGKNLPTICFCVNVEHAKFIKREFLKRNVPAEIMTAKTPTDVRRDTIWRFEQGIIKIIVNVGVLVAGFDSDVRCIIYARPTKSKIRWVQSVGRGLRSTREGEDAYREYAAIRQAGKNEQENRLQTAQKANFFSGRQMSMDI